MKLTLGNHSGAVYDGREMKLTLGNHVGAVAFKANALNVSPHDVAEEVPLVGVVERQADDVAHVCGIPDGQVGCIGVFLLVQQEVNGLDAVDRGESDEGIVGCSNVMDTKKSSHAVKSRGFLYYTNVYFPNRRVA